METFTDDTVVALASFLSPHDMLSLSLACRRFGSKIGTNTKQSAAGREDSTREVRQRTETISLMEVAARTVLQTKWTDEERNALPRRGGESWIVLYNDFLKLFRLPLQFDKLVGGECNYVDSTYKTKVRSNRLGGRLKSSTAICNNIMRAGKHCVTFDVTNDGDRRSYGIACGIMRPTTKDITILSCCDPACDDLSSFSQKEYEILHRNNVDCCLMSTFLGSGFIRKRWKKWKESELAAMDVEQRLQAQRQNKTQKYQWEGMEWIRDASFKIGLVLDLDEGTLDVYMNDRRLGTMMSGLIGEYCWAITLTCTFSDAQVSASIGR